MLEVHHIFKTFDDKPLLNDISFQVGQGETVCLLGASGSGKSTLLRIIAGLENADSGFVSFNGVDLTSTPAHLRDFGFVFQDYALFPHLNVSENVAFGLKMRRLPQGEVARRVASSLETVNLSEFGYRKVTDLSGGEQQRVALARVLATRPRLLIFDEPLGALDRTLREDLLNELRSILHQTNIPAIYVTHDQEEAFTIADRLLILNHGQIVRAGMPVEVWADPQSVYVAGFLGLGTIVEGIFIGGSKVQTKFGNLTVECGDEHQKGDALHLLVRTNLADANLKSNIIQGIVKDVIFQEDRYKVTLDQGLYVYLTQAPKVGEKIDVRVKVECLA